jgi:hypothetical protein
VTGHTGGIQNGVELGRRSPLSPAPPPTPAGPARVERDGTSAQFNPNTPADQQLRDWGWDPDTLNPSQLEVLARRYAHSDQPLIPHVDLRGKALPPNELGLDDLTNAWLHANPDINGGTKFLALIGDEETRKRITDRDDQLQKVNAAALTIRPNELGYRTATLNGTEPEPSNMIGAADRLKAAVDRVVAIHGHLRKLYSGEYASECLTKIGNARVAKLDDYIKALSADSGAAHKAMVDAGAGALKAFRGFHDVVDRYREGIARYAALRRYSQLAPMGSVGIFGGAFSENGFRDDVDPKMSVAIGAKQAANAGDAMGRLFATPVDDVASVEVSMLGHDNSGSHGSGAAGRSYSGGHGVGGPVNSNGQIGPEPSLSPPEQAMAALASAAGMPFAPGAPSMLQAPTAPQIPLPLASGGPHTALEVDHNAENPLHDSLDPSKDHDRRTFPQPQAADAVLVPPPIRRPGDPVRPGELGADMKPLDKDGDGRMDADAIAPTQNNMDKGHHGKPDKVATAVMIGGVPHAVWVDDPRLLEMMNTLGAADPDHPVDVLDAAAQAGMPLSGYGQFLDDPMTAKTGDVLTGSKDTGMYLEGGQVLMQDGSVKPLMDVLEFRPPNSGFFRLELPALPAGADEPNGSDPPAPQIEPAAAPPAAQHQEQPRTPLEAPAAPVEAVHQQSAQVAPPESGQSFPVIVTETTPRSW